MRDWATLPLVNAPDYPNDENGTYGQERGPDWLQPCQSLQMLGIFNEILRRRHDPPDVVLRSSMHDTQLDCPLALAALGHAPVGVLPPCAICPNIPVARDAPIAWQPRRLLSSIVLRTVALPLGVAPRPAAPEIE